MAIDFLKGAAQGIAGRALRKVAGNIRGGLLGTNQRGGSNLSDTAGLDNTKYNTKNFSFPIDVEGPPGTGNQGHYIMFQINLQTNSKLVFGEVTGEGLKNMEKGRKEHALKVAKNNEKSKATAATHLNTSMPGNLGAADNEAAKKLKQQKALEKQTENFKKISTVQVQRPATVLLDTAITLYMPPTVSVSYGAEYTDTEIGAAAAIGAQAYQDVVSGKSLGDTVNKSLKSLGPEIGDGMIRKALGAIDMIPGLEGAMEVVEMQRGFVKAPRMELAFKGIPKRDFSYDFKMIPKSFEEAEEIQKIIKAFKMNMLPEMVEGSASRLTMPNTFDIKYMYANAENTYLHKISTCVLESMNVSYGGDRYKTFDAIDGKGAPPVEVSMSLSFKEMDLITRENANQGF